MYFHEACEEEAGLLDAADSGAEGYWRWKLDHTQERARKGVYIPSTEFADLYSQLGEKDQAFEWLEKAYKEREGGLMFLKVNLDWDPLRDDPRFQDLLRRMNLEP